MRLLLYGVSLSAAILLWLLIKLDRTYTVSHTIYVEVGGQAEPFPIEVEVEGNGYDLLRWRRMDTIPAAQLCIAPPRGVNRINLHWDQREFHRRALCERLKLIHYKPTLRWILPKGADFVEPPEWLSDSVWVLSDTLPAWEYELVAKPGIHRYPIPLPRRWGAYPETLWVEGHVAQYIYATVEVPPSTEGTQGYTLVLTPPKVQVHFWVPQSMADRWKPEDFQVVVDMRKVLPTDTVVYPELRQRPPYVRRVEIQPPALSFTRLY